MLITNDILMGSVGIANKQYSNLIARVTVILLEIALKMSFIKRILNTD